MTPVTNKRKGAVTKTLMNRRILSIAAVVATGAERGLSRVPFDAIAGLPESPIFKFI
jgi:hypothetical protein